jgi:hypothetical protein
VPPRFRWLRLGYRPIIPLLLLALACNFPTSVERQTAVPTWALPSRLTATALATTATAPSESPEPASTSTPEPGGTATPPSPSASPTAPESDFHAARGLAPPPGIDGDLAEWAALPYTASTAVFGQGNWQGADDLSAAWNIAWDDANLYVAVRVRDDAYVQLATGDQIFKGDGVELLLDADLVGDAGSTRLSGDDFQLGISAGKLASPPAAPEAYRWYPGDKAGPVSNVLVAARLVDGGYEFEAAVPWSIFGVTPAAGQVYGFALSISDDDSANSAEQQSMVSSSPRRSLTDPTTWGVLELDAAP